MVVLRDGRKIIGTMRSFDQFSNIVLEQAFERVIVGNKFGDVPLGLYVIRGENIVLLGQLVRPSPRRAPAAVATTPSHPAAGPLAGQSLVPTLQRRLISARPGLAPAPRSRHPLPHACLRAPVRQRLSLPPR